ncbi:PQQ-binding-like beta-propeller repeat protein [Aquabacterium sp. A7-Y]|uniref:outer membrane protein assembly factor BamB family protein n=1 Tax=Aquabacterium sp. A7-Y TaxID=1349605 RepID=UPI00223E2C6C|nr:PQQ-binding-like beta-propeller repeat protein [Aquabacterium sp. A7-Y]MCW7538515.1 PQQ-binding-like beta-propeller repeat protein [Aquabacterium sp. A7-Y]
MFRKSILAGIVACLAAQHTMVSAQPAQARRDVEWRSYAASNASSKYAPANQIHAGNVGALVEKWVWDSPDNAFVEAANAEGTKLLWPHAYESTPLMVDGKLYVSTSLSQVAAIDASSGQTLWVHNPKSYLSADGRNYVYPPNIGLVQRGVAYWRRHKEERIFFATGNANLIALDAKTGQLEPGFGQGGVVDLKQGLRFPVNQALYGMSSPPLVCGNVVVVGSVVLDFPLQTPMPVGDVRGYDAASGRLLWTFHTVPQEGEKGADTWTPEARAVTGGANVWAPMSCDDKTGVVYMPVSTPTNDYYGGNRIGHNWFADSLVAVHARTGKLIWNYQLLHHSLWDYDPPAAPNLVEMRQHGRLVKAVAQITKQGFVYVFDRATGRPIWPIEERPVPQSLVPGEQTSPTQPFPTKPLPFDRQGLSDNDLIDFTPELRERARATIAPYVHGPLYTPPVEDRSATLGKRGTLTVPGGVGGGSWTGAAFHPKTGILYVPSVTKPAVIRLWRFSNTLAGSSDMLTMADGLPITKPPYGRLTAIDLNSGDHLWMRPVGRGPVNHPELAGLGLKDLGWDRRSFFLVTDTLLFGVQEGIIAPSPVQLSELTVLFRLKNDDAFLWAMDPRTGEKRLELPMKHGNATGSPMTYQVNGRQFIVVPVGGAGHPAKLVAYGLP